MKSKIVTSRKQWLAATLVLLLSIQCLAEEVLASPRTVAGIVLFAVGDIKSQSVGGTVSLARGSNIYVGDTIYTGADGYLNARMADGAYFSLKASSQLLVETYIVDNTNPQSERVKLVLSKGLLRSVTGGVGERSKTNFRLNTPVAAIGVRGTDFSIHTTSTLSQIAVARGGVAISPYTDSCFAQDFGPCGGDLVRELFAGEEDTYLELKKGAGAANRLEGRLDYLMPVLEEVFNTSQPVQPEDSSDKDSGTRKISETLTLEIKNLLTEALDEESKRLNHEASLVDGEIALQDSDGDGIVDTLDPDRDNDGIANSLEEQWLLDANLTDTDNDGLSDFEELFILSNPIVADTDADGVLDGSDRSPLTDDNLYIDGHQLSPEDVDALEVLTSSVLTSLTQQLLKVTLNTALGEDQISSSLGFDSASNFWWGDADSLALLSSIMPDRRWQDLKKLWTVNFLLAGELSREEIEQIIRRWQQTPNRIVGSETLSVLLAVDTGSFEDGSYVFSPEFQVSDGMLVTEGNDAQLQILAIDGISNRFRALVLLESGSTIEISGRIDEGVLYGRNGDLRLRGGVVDGSNITVVLSSENNDVLTRLSMRRQVDDGLENILSYIPAAENIEWGRWSDFALLTNEDLEKISQQLPLLSSNKHFALLRQETDNYQLPETGRYSFTLNDYEAIHVNGDLIEEAKVEQASLEVEFPLNRFAFYMGVSAAGLTDIEVLRAYGAIDVDGVMNSDNVLSNTDVTGFLGNNANDAGLLFEKQLGDDQYISGASQWIKNN